MIEPLLKGLDALTRHVTAGRALTVFLLVFSLLGTWTLFEQRQAIYEKVVASDRFNVVTLETIGPDSQTAIRRFLNRHPEVGFLTVLNVDLQLNVRRPLFRDYNDASIRQIVTSYEVTGNDGTLPVFQRDALASNNHMISLLQGEYSCTPFDSGALAKVMPNLVGRIKLSCRVPIPPGWGKGVTGYIVFHTTRELTQTELETLKMDGLALSMYVYGAEVKGAKDIKMLP